MMKMTEQYSQRSVIAHAVSFETFVFVIASTVSCLQFHAH